MMADVEYKEGVLYRIHTTLILVHLLIAFPESMVLDDTGICQIRSICIIFLILRNIQKKAMIVH